MIRTQTSLVLKYSQALDRFVRIRRFSVKDEESLLAGADITDKHTYVDLIVNACVVDLEEVLARKKDTAYEDLREELYLLAVEVNSELEISRVTVPVRGEESQLVILEKEDLGKRDGETQLALDLEEALSERVVGQEDAVRAVAMAVRRAYAGIRDETKPVGCFLFIGPTGVGKTELAKVLADALYGDHARHLLRVDCSEYSMGHEYAKLIGAPPGYIGHENGGYLTESMLKMGEGIVLFDEVEKAHEKVHNLLLQLMDEGFMTDGKGRRVDFCKSLVILTSNLGVKEVKQMLSRAGFGRTRRHGEETREELRDAGIKAVKDFFSPEFINRLDEVVVFGPIEGGTADRILDLALGDLARRLKRKGLGLDVSKPVRKLLLKRGIDRRYGARPLKRVVRKLIEAPLAELLLEKEPGRATVHAGLSRSGEIRFTFKPAGTKIIA